MHCFIPVPVILYVPYLVSFTKFFKIFWICKAYFKKPKLKLIPIIITRKCGFLPGTFFLRTSGFWSTNSLFVYLSFGLMAQTCFSTQIHCISLIGTDTVSKIDTWEPLTFRNILSLVPFITIGIFYIERYEVVHIYKIFLGVVRVLLRQMRF